MANVTIADSVYGRVRDDIIFGELLPGSRLKLEVLRSRYGLSVPTLREVLSRLTSEGLVDAEGQKGFSVATVSVSGLREVADMRRLIESDALRSSFASGGIDWEARIIAAHHRLSRVEANMSDGASADVPSGNSTTRTFTSR